VGELIYLYIIDVFTYLLLLVGCFTSLRTNMEWTDAKEDILIDLWRQYPCLYDDVRLLSYITNNAYQLKAQNISPFRIVVRKVPLLLLLTADLKAAKPDL